MTADRHDEMQRLVAQERLIIEVTERLVEALEARGVSRRELGQRLGVSPAEITQRLQGTRNLTLRTVADMMNALEYDLAIDLRDRLQDRGQSTQVTLPVTGEVKNWEGARYAREPERRLSLVQDVA